MRPAACTVHARYMVLYSTCLTYRSKQASTTAGGLGTGLACHQPVKKNPAIRGAFCHFWTLYPKNNILRNVHSLKMAMSCGIKFYCIFMVIRRNMCAVCKMNAITNEELGCRYLPNAFFAIFRPRFCFIRVRNVVYHIRAILELTIPCIF